MKIHCLTDVYFFCGDTKLFHQLQRIAVGPVRGAIAGHGHTVYMGGGSSQNAHCLHGHQQSQCRIQAARDTDHRLGAYDFQPMRKARHLHTEDFHTAVKPVRLGCRYKGELFDFLQGAVRPQGRHGGIHDFCAGYT